MFVVLAGKGFIRTVSLAHSGSKKGARLYRLKDALDYLDSLLAKNETQPVEEVEEEEEDEEEAA
jgi:pimeloyl-CoA synthetase